MIGNDIVDLKTAVCHCTRRFERYAAKVCSLKEIAQIGRFETKQQSLWRLWSLKEAGYKASLRLKLCDHFSPSKIGVELLDECISVVKFEKTQFTAWSVVNTDYVYSEVVLGGADIALQRSIVTADKSQEMKQRITRKGKLPFINTAALEPKIASVSHHGRFYALVHQC